MLISIENINRKGIRSNPNLHNFLLDYARYLQALDVSHLGSTIPISLPSPFWVLNKKTFYYTRTWIQFGTSGLQKISSPPKIQYQVSWFWLAGQSLDKSLFCDTLMSQGSGYPKGSYTHRQADLYPFGLTLPPEVPHAPLQFTRCWVQTSCGRWTWIGGNPSVAQLTRSVGYRPPFF